MKKFILCVLIFLPHWVYSFDFSQDPLKYKKKINRRPGASLSEQTHKLLTRAQEDLSAGDTERAFKALKKLESRTASHPGEQAQVVQALGYAYAQKEDEAKALKAFEKTLDLDALPEAPTLSVLYLVGQLYALKGQHSAAENALKFYLAMAPRANAQVYAMLAASLIEQKKKKEALGAIQKAIDLSPKPNESWLAMAVSLYFANERYDDAARVLKILVAQNPKKQTYWKQWAQSHLSAGEDKEGLVAMEMGYINGSLKEDKNIKDAASLMMSTEIPYKATLWIEKRMSVKERNTLKTQKTLASAYMMARENKKALNVLRQIHKNTPEVRTSIQLGQILLEEEQWKEASQVFSQISKKKLEKDQVELVQMGLGVSYFNLGDQNLARQSFVSIADRSEAAQGWLNFIQSQSPE